MLIPASKISKYFKSMVFPVDVYGEEGEEILFEKVTRVQLERLIAKQAIIGVGNWNTIKRLRLNHMATTAAVQMKAKEALNAQTNMGVYLQQLGTAHMDKDGKVVEENGIAHTWAFCALRRAGI